MTKGKSHRPKALFQVSKVLWHLDIFRRSFRDLSGHACMAEACIFCALKELFAQLQSSTETALPPDALRRALASTFFDQNRFQLGCMDDAAECFENMLVRIHAHVAPSADEDMCDARHCIPHRKFAMTLVEQSACSTCGATSEPLSYTQMVHYVSTSTLVYQVRTGSNRMNPDPFGLLLRKAGNMGDVRTCPSSCGAVIQIGRTLTNHPEIVSIGLVWNSERPTLEHIMEVFSTIGTSLRLSDVFNMVDKRWAETSIHNLVGVVTYYGKHYSTFFFHTKLRVWIYFDDATVKEIGPRWDQVVEKCRKGRYQPLLLLYALPDGTPVSTETAPKHITPLVTDKINKSTLRRSVTPSPEKPIVGNTRRAITPNPDGSPLCQKPPLPRHCNDYQNLTVIQKNIYHTDADTVDGYGLRKESEYATRKSLDFDKPQVNVHRTLSNSSSSGIEGMSDHTNTPRRRDSGNWSGDRNSASSASSTTMENPYLYLIGKVPQGAGSVPGSPTRTKSDSSSGSSGIYDAGYDSYSLSSNDSSSMTTLQHLMKMGHLAKIPEDYSNVVNQSSQSCDILCDEADELLVKSRELEDQHDLVLALALCNAAATKARAAMNAPYNNPQTLTLARMKHNTCIMRARSLHRRMTQTQPNKETPPEIRHTREGSSGSGRHSRQNSRDKSSHSRQNSRELLVPDKEKIQPTKNIEIYATLPKKRDSLKNKLSVTTHDDAEYVLYDKPSGRESRSIFSRSKNKDQKAREKRSRSEDRNKISRDFSIAPEIITGKDTLKKTKEEKEEKKEKDGKSKKQHKIRRKLLMGGLIKRKNRSMPDLTDANVVNDGHHNQAPTSSVDDSNVGLKDSFQMQSSCGYLSEGHLEFTGCNPNPNLERSKLMRKSFHGSAGKILTAAKVPPPPPLRTTSQLSKTKSYGEVDEDNPVIDINSFQETHDYHYMNQAPVSLPYYNNNSFSDESFYNETPTTIVTRADVHQELNPSKETCNADNGVDEVDCLPSHLTQPNLDLPPYPSPMGSVVHSRQASEDFPPPPPPLDLSALDEHLPQANQNPSTLLSELQNKRQEILSQTADLNKLSSLSFRSSGDTWLRELQAKQAALRNKKNQNDTKDGVDVVNTQRYLPGEPKSVKDLASKFEGSDSKNFVQVAKPEILKNDNNNNNGVLSMKKREEHDTIGPEQIAEEIREVEMLRAAVHKTLNVNQEGGDDGKKKLTKKKSVSFCDQVILVATADEQEDDSYIPNPILERVLRTAMNNPEAAAIKQEIISLRENLEQNGNNENLADNETYNHPLYVRRNSVDNLLSKNTQLNIEQQRRNNANYAAQVQSSMPQNNNATMSCSVQNQYHNEQMNVCDQSLQSGSQQYCNPQIQYSHPNLTRQSSYNDIYNPYGRTHVPQSPEIVNQQFNYNTQNCQYTYETQCPPNCSAGQNYNIQTPYRQSPYQLVPQNSHAYATHYNNNGNKIANHPQQLIMRNGMGQTRQTTPSPMNGVYSSTPPSVLHPPSPSPSNGNVNYNYLQQAYRYDNQNSAFPKCPTPAEGTNRNVNENILHNSSYQRIPVDHQSNSRQQSEYMLYQKAPLQSTDQQRNLPVDYVQNGSYQRLPPTSGEGLHNYIRTQQHPAYQMGPNQTEVYQRVPPTHCDQDMSKYSPYQHVLPPKMNLKKSVTFDPTTKGGSELGTPRPVVTPIIVNNSHNSIPTDKTKCNLCRKKNVAASNLYCQDCEFYMSRFKPRS